MRTAGGINTEGQEEPVGIQGLTSKNLRKPSWISAVTIGAAIVATGEPVGPA
jgi:hypothetical protein